MSRVLNDNSVRRQLSLCVLLSRTSSASRIIAARRPLEAAAPGAVALEPGGGGARAIDSIYFLSAAPNPADAGASLVALMPATSLVADPRGGAAGRILLAFSRDGVRWRGLRTLAHTESEGTTGRTVDQNAAGVLTRRAARGKLASFYVQRNVPGISGDGATALKRIDIPLSLLECWTRSALGGSEGRTSPTTAEFARVPPRA